MPVSLLSLLASNWKAIVVALAIGLVGVKGYWLGQYSTQAKWDASVALIRAETEKEKDVLRDKSAKASAEYQAKITKQKSEINKVYKALNYEISKSYSSCVATPELVRVWTEGFGAD
jgi:hypothetical protein